MSNGPPPRPNAANSDEISSLGKYQIQKKIGAGGMGTVYLAVDQQLKRTVALKVLPKDKADNKTLVRRFKAEGQAGAQLEHPNIVSVYESGEIDGYLYLAMEYVEGLDAYELLKKRGVLPAKRSLEIIKQVVQALDHAYDRSVVHRDIKPSNLLIRDRDGLVKLADMGLARVIEDDGESGITKAGTTVGTVDYMSPEQARDSKQADTRSDIYSLGCTWYHLLAGKAPFPDGDLMNKLRAHAMQPVPDPRDWNDSIPAGIVAVIQRMMAKKPDDRYQNPKQLLADLNSPALLRSGLSADLLSMLGASHAAEPDDESDDEEVEAPSNTKTAKRKSPGTAPGKSGGPSRVRVEREEPEPEDDAPSPSPKFKKNKTPDKSTGKRPAGREALPPRAAAEPASAETDGGGGKKTKSERVLPGRIDQPLLSEAPSTSLDPDKIKLILLILIVLGGVGGIFVAIKSYSQSGSGSNDVINPYAIGADPGLPTVAPTTINGDPGNAAPGTAPPPSTLGPSQIAAPAPTVVTNAAPPSTVPSAQDSTPFGGVITGGTQTLPPWIAESRLQAPNLPPQVVRLQGAADGEFSGIPQALNSTTANAFVQFADDGPHEIPALEKKTLGTWTIRGAPGTSPILVLRSRAIQVNQGTLVFDGVHLVLTSDRPDTGLRVGAGKLVIRHSTVTHLGPNAEGLIIADANGKVLIEDSIVRTQGTCIPVTLRGAGSGLALGNSLIVAGNARAIQLVSKDQSGDTRQVALVRSAVFSGQAGFTCTQEGRQPPTLEILLRQSMVGYLPGHNADAIGIEFQGWPKADIALDRPRVSSVAWTSEKSALVGWPHWAMLGFSDKSAPLDVRDSDAWHAFWRSPTSPGELIPEGTNLKVAAGAAALVTADQIESGLTGAGPQLADIGPSWKELSKPPQSTLANLIAFDQKTRLPPGLESPDPGTSLRFDLKKPSLGKYLTSDEVPDGSTVIAFGSGLRTIDPFVLKQKRVQVIFEQTEGVPLVIQPGYKTEPGAVKPAAWFGVEDGQLTVENGFFRMLSGNRNYPERFLQMAGGLALVRKCRVEGVDTALPLVDLVPSAGHAPPQILLDRTILTGFRSAVRIGAAEAVMELRHSVLSSTAGTTVSWDAGSSGAHLLVNHSTLAGGKAVFEVFPLGAATPIELFSERSVYEGGCMLSLGTDASAVVWWGRENAYSSDMKTFLVTGGTAAGPQDFHARWEHGWGGGHEMNPVYGANRVLLPALPATPIDTQPESFSLHADCDAAKSGLGANIADVGPVRTAASKPAAPTVKPNTPPVRPVVPGF